MTESFIQPDCPTQIIGTESENHELLRPGFTLYLHGEGIVIKPEENEKSGWSIEFQASL